MGVERGTSRVHAFTHSFNLSFDKYFLNSYYEPGTVVMRTSVAPAPTELRDSQ